MKTFRGFQVFDFNYRAKSKTRKPRKWALFLLKPHHKVNCFLFWVIFSQFLDFDFDIFTKNSSKRILPKIQVKENFPRFPRFRFWVQSKIENSAPLKLAFFLLKPEFKVNVFSFWVIFQSVIRFRVSYTTKDLSKRKLFKIFEFQILVIGQNRKLGNLRIRIFSY